MKEISIERVRQKFPNPQTARDDVWVEGSYCVGGALVMFATGNPDFDFPDHTQLSDFFEKANQMLGEVQAGKFALSLMNANDEGRFEDAWAIAEEAITFGQ